MAKLQIKLVRSTIGATPKQKKNVEALGLRRREQVVVTYPTRNFATLGPL